MIDELDREIHAALAALLDLAPEPAEPAVSEPRSAEATRRPVAVAAGVIVALAVGTTMWFATRPTPTAPTLTAASSTELSVSGSSTTSTTSSPGTTAVDPAVAAATLPDLAFDPNELIAQTSEQTVTLTRGIGIAIRTCMAKAGFDYHPPKVFPPPTYPRIKDEAWRSTYGYGYPRQDTSDPTWDAWITEAQKDPAFMRALLQRDPDGHAGGCTNSAYLRIYPPKGYAVSPQNDTFLAALRSFLENLYGPVDQRLSHARDPELETARSAWAACMKAAGIDAVYPGGLASQMLRTRTSSREDEGVTREEITVALQDWTCETSTGFLQHWYGRLQQLTAQFAQEHADVIRQIRQWNADATARAQQAIDAGS
jgi:hypothetical protein